MTMDVIIKWNTEHNGVEIQANDEHFVIDAQPSRVMNWYDAVEFCKNTRQTLPTKKQLQLAAKHIDEINTLLKQHGGDELFGWHWSSDKYNKFCAWSVRMLDGYTGNNTKSNDSCVRAVSVIRN